MVELRPLRREDFPRLSRWLAEPLVARWWDDDASPEAVERDYCPVPAGALSIDYLVGEPEARGRGLAAGMVAAAVARGFADHPDAQDVLVPQGDRTVVPSGARRVPRRRD